jgi:hypothetical protein
MEDHIARWFGWMKTLIAPRAPGRHSRGYAVGSAVAAAAPPRAPRVSRLVRPAAAGMPEQDGSAMERPRSAAHEVLDQLRQQRRAVPEPAAMILVRGPRCAHRVEVVR